MSTTQRMLLVLALLGSLTAGCQPTVAISDSLGSSITIGASDELRSPYVVGLDFTITIIILGFEQPTRFTAEIAPSGIIAVKARRWVSSGTLELDCTAEAPGEVSLTVRDGNGRIQERRALRTQTPDGLALVARGQLEVLGDRAQPIHSSQRLRLLVGHEQSFQVRYLLGEEELAGNHLLSVLEEDQGVSGRVPASDSSRDHDWLRVAVSEPGAKSLLLGLGKNPPLRLELEGVTEASVQSIRIEGEESAPTEGVMRCVVARAFDREGQEIFGASPQWSADVDGKSVPVWSSSGTDSGDEFCYSYQKDRRATLTAAVGSVEGQTQVDMKQGYVLNSSIPGCSMGGHSARGPLGLAILAALLLCLGALRSRTARSNM